MRLQGSIWHPIVLLVRRKLMAICALNGYIIILEIRYMLHQIKNIVVGIGLLFSISTEAINSELIEKNADASIQELYHSLSATQNSSFVEKLSWFSSQFQDRAYLLGALGEGPNARYDQFPRYRTDAFDCDTYVNTVLALALSDSLPTFQQCINNLRYINGIVSYVNRKHFTSVDWNTSNQQSGLLVDITLSIHDKKNQRVAQYASAVIDKPGWYAHKTMATIRIKSQNYSKHRQRLIELQAKGRGLAIIRSQIPLLPFTVLFPKNNEPDLYLFAQIPHGAVIELVRENWDLRKELGTFLDISHLGFAFWRDHILYFRQASSQYNKVIEMPLITYLKEAIDSPTTKGINVQIVGADNKSRHC